MKKQKNIRPACAQRLTNLRKAAGLSQKELADRLGIAPSNIGFWELHNKPPRSDLLPKIAKTLNVSVDEILGTNSKPKPNSGPQGRTRKVFEAVSGLPRNQQQRIISVVEDMLTARKTVTS